MSTAKNYNRNEHIIVIVIEMNRLTWHVMRTEQLHMDSGEQTIHSIMQIRFEDKK